MVRTKKTTSSVTATRNYRLFTIDEENRTLDLPRHKHLKISMQTYGFLGCYPIVCKRGPKGELIVKDGQHRLAFAEELGLLVFYVVESTDFDIATINNAQKCWSIRDYAIKFATNGKADYQEALEFVDRYGLCLTHGCSLLAGTTTFSNIKRDYYSGEFVIKDRQYADVVASVYSALCKLSSGMRNARCMEALMAVARIPDIDISRVLRSANRCRDKLGACANRDGYLQLVEDLYNHCSKRPVPLKFQALEAMRKRNPATKNESKTKK